MDTMTNKKRHHYKHRESGVVSVLNDSFVSAFGEGAFERVDDDNESANVADTNQPAAVVAAADQPAAEPVAANPQNVTDNTESA